MTDVKVEQCDWEKAKRYRGQLGHWTLGDRSMFETLAEDFARHRQAAEKATRERDAGIAEARKPMGYMSDRERSYCEEHGEEIATAIRRQNDD